MTTAPYAKLRANIASAGNLSGALVGAAGATCQLSQDPAGLGSSWLYEIVDYPEGFPTPTGWSLDATSGVYSYSGLTPPSFTLPALPLWGKLLFRLTVNHGDPGTSGLDKTQFIDSTTVVSTPDPSGNGFEDIAYCETNQWDSKRKWMGPHKRNIRRMAKRALPDYTSVADGYVLSLVGGVPTWVPGTSTNFGALMPSCIGYWRGDLGLHTTGSIVNTWDNQVAGAGNITEHSAGVGIANVGTGVGGKPSLAPNGTTQAGDYTLALVAPATTNFHVYAVYTIPNAGANQVLVSDSSLDLLVFAAPSSGALLQGYDGSFLSCAESYNTWARGRVSFTGSASDVIKWGSATPVTGASMGNAASSGTRHLFYDGSTNWMHGELALLLFSSASLATFLAALPALFLDTGRVGSHLIA